MHACIYIYMSYMWIYVYVCSRIAMTGSLLPTSSELDKVEVCSHDIKAKTIGNKTTRKPTNVFERSFDEKLPVLRDLRRNFQLPQKCMYRLALGRKKRYSIYTKFRSASKLHANTCCISVRASVVVLSQLRTLHKIRLSRVLELADKMGSTVMISKC